MDGAEDLLADGYGLLAVFDVLDLVAPLTV